MEYIVGLDIGTTKIACFIGKKAPNGKISIVGFGRTESVGVEHGIVRNIISTADSIRRAVADASDMAKVDVHEVYVGIAGQHIKSRTNQGSIIIPDDHRQIAKSDVDRLIDDQYHVLLDPGEQIIHVFPQDFIVDNDKLGNNIDPVGVAGKCLVANFHIVTGNTANLAHIRDAVEEAGLRIKGVVLEPIASSFAVLNDLDREAGVALVDIGGGTTDIAIFHEGIIRHTTVLPLAGNAITNDIRESCQILKTHAESLKTKFGSCLPSSVNPDDIISIPGIRNQPAREIKIKTLATIIKVRVEMILQLIKYEIDHADYHSPLIAGVVLTGGGSSLNNIKEFAALTIGIDTRIGYPDEHIDKETSIPLEELGQPMYATGLGLVMYGIREEERAEREAARAAGNAQPKEDGDEEDSSTDSDIEQSVKGKKSKKEKKEKKDKKSFGEVVNKFLTDILTDDSVE